MPTYCVLVSMEGTDSQGKPWKFFQYTKGPRLEPTLNTAVVDLVSDFIKAISHGNLICSSSGKMPEIHITIKTYDKHPDRYR